MWAAWITNWNHVCTQVRVRQLVTTSPDVSVFTGYLGNFTMFSLWTLKQDSHVPHHPIQASQCSGEASSTRAGFRERGEVSDVSKPTTSTVVGNSCVWQVKTHGGLLRSITWPTIPGNFTTGKKDTWSQWQSFHSLPILLLCLWQPHLWQIYFKGISSHAQRKKNT